MTAKRAVVVIGLLLGSAAAALAQPVARVSIRQPPPFLAGQSISIDVQALVPTFFLSPVTFPTIDIPGAIVTMPDESGMNMNATIDGVRYYGVQKTYVFVAVRAGQYTLPPAAITFTYAGDGAKPLAASVTLPSRRIDVEWPPNMPESAAAAGMLVAPVTIEQHLDRDPKELRVGDALTRTVRTAVEHTQAMFIPPPVLTAPPGVRTYPKDPELSDDRGNRGELVGGHRIDVARYVFEREGEFELPAVTIDWFDVEAAKPRTARGPGVHVSVAPASMPGAAIAPEPPPPAPEAASPRLRGRTAGRVAVGALILVAFGVAVRRWWPQIRQHMRARRVADEESEAAAFHRFYAACGRGDAAASYAALIEWLRRFPAGSIDESWPREGAAGHALAVLRAQLYSGSPNRKDWDGRSLGQLVAAERRRRAGAARRGQVRGRHLPPLNPPSGTRVAADG